MILGLSIGAFTVFHVILSLVGIGSGFVAVFGLINESAAASVDRAFSDHHDSHQRDWIPVSVPRVRSRDCGRNSLADCPSAGDDRAVRRKACGRLARDICYYRSDSAVLQRLRALCAAVRKGSRAQGHRANAVVTCFRIDAAGGAGGVYCARHPVVQGFSRLSAGLGSRDFGLSGDRAGDRSASRSRRVRFQSRCAAVRFESGATRERRASAPMRTRSFSVVRRAVAPAARAADSMRARSAAV